MIILWKLLWAPYGVHRQRHHIMLYIAGEGNCNLMLKYYLQKKKAENYLVALKNLHFLQGVFRRGESKPFKQLQQNDIICGEIQSFQINIKLFEIK